MQLRSLRQSAEARDLDDVGVLKVFKLRTANNFHRKHSLPLLFLVRIKKAALPLYLKYDDLKRDYPQILIEFLEKKFQIVLDSERIVSKRDKSFNDSNISLNIEEKQTAKALQLLQIQKCLGNLKQNRSNSKLITDSEEQMDSNRMSKANDIWQSTSEICLKNEQKPQKEAIRQPTKPLRPDRKQKQIPFKVKATKRFIQQSIQKPQPPKAAQLKQVKETVMDYEKIMQEYYGVDWMISYVPAFFKKPRMRQIKVGQEKRDELISDSQDAAQQKSSLKRGRSKRGLK